VHTGELEIICLPDVPSSPGPNDCMVELLGLTRSTGPGRKENLLEDNLCFFEDGWILDKNVVACLRVRYHELYVLFPSDALIIRPRCQKSSPAGHTQRNHRCVLWFHMSSVVLRGKKWHRG
jgi:hypothetical protein